MAKKATTQDEVTQATQTQEATPTQESPAQPASQSTTVATRQVSAPPMKYNDPFAGSADGGILTDFNPADFDLIDQAQDKNVGLGELQISRIAIGQPLTPEIAQKVQGYEGMDGCFLDSISREIISTRGKYPWLLERGVEARSIRDLHYLPVIPIFKLPTEFALWPSKDERKADPKNKRFHWKTLDATEDRVRDGLWPPKGRQPVVKGEPPKVTEHINWLVLPLDKDFIQNGALKVQSFSRTSFKAGQRLTTNIANLKLNKRLPAFGQIQYLFTGMPETNDQGTFYVIQVAPGPLISAIPDGRDYFRMAMDLAKKFADPQTGRQMQEMYINAAAFTEDESIEGEAGSGSGGTDDPEPQF